MIIEAKQTKNGKIKIYADGEELFTVPAVIWYSSRFHDGDDAEMEELSELKAQGDSSCAFESGMRMLSLRAHSEYELRQKLRMKYPPDAVNSAIERLVASGLIDDEKFAFLLAEELHERKGFAPKRILMELKNRGISSALAENAVNSLDIDTKIGIINIIEKYSLTENSSRKEKDRVIRRLISMGYSFSDISRYISIYEQDE